MMHNFIAYVPKGGDFLKFSLMTITSCILSRSKRKRGKLQHLHVQNARVTVLFKTLGFEIRSVVVWGGEKGGGAWSHAFDANDPPSSN